MTFTEFIQLCNLHHNLSYYFSSIEIRWKKSQPLFAHRHEIVSRGIVLPIALSYLYWNLIKF